MMGGFEMHWHQLDHMQVRPLCGQPSDRGRLKIRSEDALPGAQPTSVKALKVSHIT